ncbi:zinc finger CDGSH-type domain-containing protein [Toxoplasma gondii TgCatPRC2]|uniref:Zinc finger CDGSH-type domain-containing protein n=15 Tax=Toxoplasma gondii TaxID=5811 RepID=B9PWU0_TOXGV|nr:zinc finger CDGSH-type domain-containing protein [Toxoplasma gondii ME49]EPR59038.1 zinc finger CDGSH-type domain-containing protein [Toxoplasma gondii GT1]ESS30304.1 zinc finger CDGSH-type domain-containing protein [Toxoplasma gondii VEG]KAF4645330.1 zinc finger CDGSH-type domain-containing protein [Toxoplasma gondii]KFG35516.1 zinc finger CDGSH-type domain-containing protein [Toxoplasma gondii GAB2-2007-GAL-DOM2]KFG46898.1 zinc finger CDGSH-type domain-containing protein [Toxoplasma gondi|eukprot:XP_002369458.1 zinc finger CDGSH-type domain-containing protein [Toxoplasma gondii ME49]
MVWQEWWPYDPQPQPQTTNPYLVHCEKGKVYWWCSCGLSKTQPWCDGAHKGTPFKPVMYIPSITGKKLLCGCKHSGSRPLCNGTHLWVKCNNNTPLACVASFAAAFSVGVASTYLMHG